MSWHLTVGETALFVPLGVVTGATVTYFATRKTARDTLTAQRQLAFDQRLWEQKSAIYQEVIGELHKATAAIAVKDLPALTKQQGAVSALALKMRILATDDASDSVGAVIPVLFAYTDKQRTGNLTDPSFTPEEQEHFEQKCDDMQLFGEITRRCIQASDAMRHDLSVTDLRS
jgi:hypothetical protein